MSAIPAGVKIRSSDMVPDGNVLIAADYEHPETPMFEFAWGPAGLTSQPASVPDGRIIYCRPEDEQRVRDAVAVAQERPKWWEDWQRIERAIREALAS